MKPIQVILSTLFAVAFLSCNSTQYGSRKYPVKLNTVPPNCQAWVVSRTVWQKQKDELLAPDGKALEEHQSQTTPCEIWETPYVFIFVARDAERHLLWKEFTPSRDATVTLEFGPPPQPTAPVSN